MLKLPTIKELLAGLCDDGTLPPLHSAKLYPPGESPVAAKQKSRAELLSEQIVLRGLMDQLEDLEACREWHLLCLKAGKKALGVEHGVTEQQRPAEQRESGDAEKGSGSAKRCLTPFSPEAGPPEMVSGTGTVRSQTPFPERDSETAAGEDARNTKGAGNTESQTPLPDPDSGAIPDSPTPIPVARAGADDRITGSPASQSSVSPLRPVKHARQTAAGEDARNTTSSPAQIKPLSVATLAERAARALPKVTEARVAVLREVAKLAAAIDMRSAFLHDRAHSVVVDTLFAMDEAFEEVGFGSWMPFRYPDQFILFTGLLSRVLAANGLIAAKHPDIYRRLLDETPPVEREPETPMGIAKCASVQPVKRLETLWRMVSGP